MQVFLEPRAWLLVVVLGSLGLVVRLAAYKLGQGGMEAVSDRFPQIKAEQFDRGQKPLQTQGTWVLVLSGVPGAGIVTVTAAGALGVRMVRPPQPQAAIDLQGLIEAEAAARRLEGQDNAILWKRPLSKREIVRANTLTVFNLSLGGEPVLVAPRPRYRR